MESMYKSMYKSSSDVKESSRAFLASSDRFTETYYTQEPFALGFLCSHGRTVCERVSVREAYIDSTFRTNSSKFELFAVLGSLLGTGFPKAYLLLEPASRKVPDSRLLRKNRIKQFLQALRRELSAFQPVFFFTDKDFGQISSISAAYGITPSICLWHLKRAVKRKIEELHKDGVEESTKEQRCKILDLITDHFNSHPFFFSSLETVHSLYLKNLQEISSYCQSHGLSNTYAYLLECWYS